MDRKRKIPSRVIFTFLLPFLVACTTTSSPTASPPPADTQVPTQTQTYTQIRTPVPTGVPSPTYTLVPSLTPTPIPTSTQVPWSDIVIGPENIGQVVEINRWGKGSIQEMVSIHKGTMAVIRTPYAIYVYRISPFSIVWMIENPLPMDNKVFMAISPDEMLLAVQFPDAGVHVFVIDSGKDLWSFTHVNGPEPPREIAWSDQEYARVLRNHFRLTSITFSTTSDLLAVGYGDSIVDVWNLQNGEAAAHLSRDIAPTPIQISFSHDDKTLISSDTRYNLLWDVNKSTPIILLPNAGSLVRKAFSPDDKKYVTIAGLYVVVYAVPSGEFLYKYGIGQPITDVFFSEDGRQLIVKVRGGYQVRDLITGRLLPDAVWNPETTSYPGIGDTLSAGFFSDLQGVAILSDNDILAWGGRTHPYFVNLPGSEYHIVNDELSMQGEFVTSPDGKLFAYCASDQLWAGDVAALEPKVVYACTDTTHLAISNDWIAWGMDTVLRILDPHTGAVRSSFIGHVRALNTLTFTANGKFLMSGSTDPILLRKVEFWIWSLDPSQAVIKILDIPHTVVASAYSPSNSIAAFAYGSSSGSFIRVVEIPSGSTIALLKGTDATTLAFSPDSQLLFVGNSDGSISVYSRADWEKIATWTGHLGKIKGLVLSPNGKDLISYSQSDGTIRVWGIPGK
jgi:WD40 repeat protein